MNFTKLLIILFALALFSCERSEVVTNSELVESPTLMELAQEISTSEAYQNYLEAQKAIVIKLRNGYEVEQELLELQNLLFLFKEAFPEVKEISEAKFIELMDLVATSQIEVRNGTDCYADCEAAAQSALESCIFGSYPGYQDMLICFDQYQNALAACHYNCYSEPSNPSPPKDDEYEGDWDSSNPGDNTDCDAQCRAAAIESLANNIGLDASDIEDYIFDFESKFINASGSSISGLENEIEIALGGISVNFSFVQDAFDQGNYFNAALNLVSAIADVVPSSDLDNALFTVSLLCHNNWC